MAQPQQSVSRPSQPPLALVKSETTPQTETSQPSNRNRFEPNELGFALYIIGKDKLPQSIEKLKEYCDDKKAAKNDIWHNIIEWAESVLKKEIGNKKLPVSKDYKAQLDQINLLGKTKDQAISECFAKLLNDGVHDISTKFITKYIETNYRCETKTGKNGYTKIIEKIN